MKLALLSLAAAIASAADPVPSSYQEIDFAQISNYRFEVPDPLSGEKLKPNQIPAKVKSLDGKRVSIRGFMLPLDLDANGVSQFILNASLDMCYFGAPVEINEWVMVTMKDGRKTPFVHTPLLISGVLSVGEEVKNGRVLSIYRLSADSAASWK